MPVHHEDSRVTPLTYSTSYEKLPWITCFTDVSYHVLAWSHVLAGRHVLVGSHVLAGSYEELIITCLFILCSTGLYRYDRTVTIKNTQNTLIW